MMPWERRNIFDSRRSFSFPRNMSCLLPKKNRSEMFEIKAKSKRVSSHRVKEDKKQKHWNPSQFFDSTKESLFVWRALKQAWKEKKVEIEMNERRYRWFSSLYRIIHLDLSTACYANSSVFSDGFSMIQIGDEAWTLLTQLAVCTVYNAAVAKLEIFYIDIYSHWDIGNHLDRRSFSEKSIQSYKRGVEMEEIKRMKISFFTHKFHHQLCSRQTMVFWFHRRDAMRQKSCNLVTTTADKLQHEHENTLCGREWRITFWQNLFGTLFTIDEFFKIFGMFAFNVENNVKSF